MFRRVGVHIFQFRFQFFGGRQRAPPPPPSSIVVVPKGGRGGGKLSGSLVVACFGFHCLLPLSQLSSSSPLACCHHPPPTKPPRSLSPSIVFQLQPSVSRIQQQHVVLTRSNIHLKQSTQQALLSSQAFWQFCTEVGSLTADFSSLHFQCRLLHMQAKIHPLYLNVFLILMFNE